MLLGSRKAGNDGFPCQWKSPAPRLWHHCGMRDAPLFRSGQLTDYLSERLVSALAAVEQASPTELQFSPQAAAERIVGQFKVEPVELDFTEISRTEPRVVTPHEPVPTGWRALPVTKFSVVVPMTGDSELLRRIASTYTMGPTPEASLQEDSVVFFITGSQLTPEQVTSKVEHFKREVTKMLEWAHTDLRNWDRQFRAHVTKAVFERKRHLDQADDLSAALTIPLVRAAPSKQVTVPLVRKQVVSRSQESSSPSAEPVLEETVYEDVLRTVGGLARAMERLPHTARRFSEPELRDLILFVLNANYEGAARGEVFNGDGKTDILLDWQGRNAFIAECKIWRGPKKFAEAIDQLAGYLVWRDTKAALVLFIRQANATAIVESADKTIRDHPLFRSATPAPEPEHRRDYLIVSKDDHNRFIRLALLPVVVPGR